jgi:hypothetical protein
MKYPEQVICRALSSSPLVAKHIGFRLFPLIVPTSAPLPFAVYQRANVDREQTLGLPPGVPKTGLSLMLFAASYSAVRELADACRERLDHLDLTSQGVSVLNVMIEDESEEIVQLEGGDLPPAWQVTFRLSIQWQEV